MQTIIFDWGGVLIEEPGIGLFKKCSEFLNVSFERYSKAHSKHQYDWERGFIEEKEMFKRVCNELKIEYKEVPWKEFFKEVMTDKKEMFAIVEHLKRNGFRVAMLSNTEKPSSANMDEKYDIFEEIVLSWEEGFAKPEKELYEITLKKLKIEPSEAIFIDDRQINIDVANKLGIKGFLFENLEKTKKFIYDLVY